MCDDCSESTSTSDTSCDTSTDTSSDTTSELPEDTGDLSDDGAEELPDDSGDEFDCENVEADDCSEEVVDDDTESEEHTDVDDEKSDIKEIEEENPDIEEVNNQDSIDEHADDIEDNSLDDTTDNDLSELEIEKLANDNLYADGSEELPDGIETSENNKEGAITDFIAKQRQKAELGINKGEFERSQCSDMVDKNEYNEFRNMYDHIDSLNIPQEYKEKLVDTYKNMDPAQKELYNYYAPDLKCNDTQCYTYNNARKEWEPSAYFNGSEGGFKFNYKDDLNNPLGACNTYFHESGHMIDYLKGKSGQDYSEINDFTDAVQKDYDKLWGQYKSEYIDSKFEAENQALKNMGMQPCGEEHKEHLGEVYKAEADEYAKSKINDILNDKANRYTTSTISDVFGGITNNEVRGSFGHSDNYWKNNPKSFVGSEAYANINADMAINNPDTTRMLNQYLPNTVNLYKNSIKM